MEVTENPSTQNINIREGAEQLQLLLLHALGAGLGIKECEKE